MSRENADGNLELAKEWANSANWKAAQAIALISIAEYLKAMVDTKVFEETLDDLDDYLDDEELYGDKE